VLHKTPGSDGMVWITLPDNAPMDMTVTANGFHHYNANASPTKYRLFVQANTALLQPDRVVPSAKFCVGQYIPFSPAWSPSEPPGIQSKLIKWSFDGNFVNDHSQANSHSSDNYFMNSDRLADESTHAWWVSGGSKAGLGEGLTFNNGQYVALAANGQFSMYRPQFTGITNQKSVEVKVVGSRLGVGDGNYSGDMQFDVQVQTSVKGAINCLQLAKEDRSFDGTFLGIVINKCFSTGGQYWLDNNLTMPGSAVNIDPDYPQIMSHYWDSPSLSGQYSYVNVIDSFETYVQFAPNNINNLGNDIYVTLGIIQWNWEGHAQCVSNIWQLVGNNSVSGVSNQPSEAFPIWINIVDNNAAYGSCN
jgi:hypothetical protein